MKRIIQIGLMVIVAGWLLTGCGQSSKESEVSVKTLSMQPQTVSTEKDDSLAIVTDLTKSMVAEKPGVSRVILTLSKKASYATSRQGNQLIINVFGAQMTSSLKQLELSDPIITSVTAKQVGNSVKGIVELTTPDIAYTPSTSTDPFQILLDIWTISPKLTQVDRKEGTKPSLPTPVQRIDVSTTGTDQQIGESSGQAEQPSSGMTQQPSSAVDTSASPGEQPSMQDVPAQLQWFSEKLSEVLQEREKIKQDLVEVEKNVAVKDSMIQVLERKLKEANLRIVELEEELIKAKSRVSLVEQNEQSMRSELQQIMSQIEGASGGQEGAVLDSPANQDLTSPSQQILSKISALQQENQDLSRVHDQVASLKSQVDSLIQERDDLQQQVETYKSEVESLQAANQRLAMIEEELQQKDRELNRLRRAIGDAAKLVMASPESSAAMTMSQPSSVQPESSPAPSSSPEPSDSSQQQGVPQEAEQPAESGGLELATLLQQYQVESQNVNPDEYVLGPGDVIQIRVLNEENLDKTVTVTPDGFITYPLLGDLRVDGLTTMQVDAQITSLLARDYLVNPEVILDVVKQRSKKVYIMGAVKQPGYHELPSDQRLLGTLLSAGGPVSFETEARILRLPKQEFVGDESVETLSPIVVDLEKLFEEGDQTQNVVLQDGDVVMVAAKKGAAPDIAGMKPDEGAQQFYVVGSVVKPGIYPYKPDDMILDAILRAGGFTEFAARNSTKLVRETDGKTRTIQVKMKDVMEKGEMDKNVAIMPGDMIIVPESFF